VRSGRRKRSSQALAHERFGEIGRVSVRSVSGSSAAEVETLSSDGARANVDRFGVALQSRAACILSHYPLHHSGPTIRITCLGIA
jgi:hypothetical protein